MQNLSESDRIQWKEAVEEPFRLFFPLAVFAGLLGVAMWPLYFWGVLEVYPGLGHSRLMGWGFFGGFIFGFLGTALPRLVTTWPLTARELAPALIGFVAMMGAYLAGWIWQGDLAFGVVLLWFSGCMGIRLVRRKDLPPPGFGMVGLAFLCALAAVIIPLADHWIGLDPFWHTLRPLLGFQGFVLLPVLGVGPFLFPRFFGVENLHDFPEGQMAEGMWIKRFRRALLVGFVLIATFFLEAKGEAAVAYVVRFSVSLLYLFGEIAWFSSPHPKHRVSWMLKAGLLIAGAGLFAAAFQSAYKVAMMHLFFAGGLAMVALMAGTRVVFGHAGLRMQMMGPRQKWLWWVAGLIWLGTATRISGDYLPHIAESHYIYGAICWGGGLLIWSWVVLPKVTVTERS